MLPLNYLLFVYKDFLKFESHEMEGRTDEESVEGSAIRTRLYLNVTPYALY